MMRFSVLLTVRYDLVAVPDPYLECFMDFATMFVHIPASFSTLVSVPCDSFPLDSRGEIGEGLDMFSDQATVC